MLHKISKIGLVLVVSLYVFHFLFFWMFESTDSFFYWAFANFIKTGDYLSVYPYNYTVPSTMEPPLYSVFLFLAQFFPRPDVLIHLIQIIAILGAGAMIYSMMGSIVALLFLLVPGHFVYMSNLVAEPIAVFLITLYLYLLKRGSLKYLLILGAMMILQRYNLIIFYGFSLFLFIRSKIKDQRPARNASLIEAGGSKTQIKNQKDDFALIVSMVILVSWILINHQFNGSWGFSNSEGKHLYNRVMHFDRLLPPSNNPDFVRFKNIVGEDKDYFLPWWYYEPALISTLGSEKASSDLMGKVARAALWTNPLKYITNNVSFFIFAHGSNPTYHDALYLWNGNMKKNCRSLGVIGFCKPIIRNEAVFRVWDDMVGKIDYFYLNLSPYVNYLLLFPSLVYAFWQKNKLFKSYAFLYLASVMLFILVEAPLPRYTYIFTPLQVILIAFLLSKVRLLRKYQFRKAIPIQDRKNNDKDSS